MIFIDFYEGKVAKANDLTSKDEASPYVFLLSTYHHPANNILLMR